MTKLSMHEHLPSEDASAPPPVVSTGDLPDRDQVEECLKAAYERYRTEAAARSRTTSLCWPSSPDASGSCRRGAGGVVRGGRRRGRVLDPECLQAVRLRARVRGDRLRGGARQLGVNSTGFPFNSLMAVELNADPHHEPAGQRRRDRDDQPRAGRHGRAEVGAGPGRAVPVRRPRAQAGREVYASESATNLRNQGIAHLLRATGGCTSIPTRPPTSTPGSARWASRSTTWP